jgi:hypothetical protein
MGTFKEEPGFPAGENVFKGFGLPCTQSFQKPLVRNLGSDAKKSKIAIICTPVS